MKQRPRKANKLKPIEVEKNLNKYLPSPANALKKAMRYSVLSGGKRIRPIITIESAKICGGSVKNAMPVACAIEFMHAYSLIHDDLPAMDNDDFRRGKPSCHKAFGEAIAILAGDALLTLAFNIIAKNARPEIGLAVIRDVSDAIGVNGMAGGQALDLEFQKNRKSKKFLNKINSLKTARLFEVSAKAGALTAGATQRQAKALQEFGFFFGMSFQAVDDRLDGENARRNEAECFSAKAKQKLKIFGKKADRLKDISDHILRRTK